MKSIRSRITLSYMLMFLGLWFIAGVFSFFYVRKAIFLHSTNSMNFLLGQKIALFDDSFEEIKENVQSLSSQIPNSSKFDETFYEKLKEKAVIAFYDQKLVKTFFFCPNPDTTASSKCLYLLSLKNSNNFRRSLFIDLSFDTSVNDKGTKERIPWYYKARENRNPAWFGAYKSYNIEDAAMVISYIIPVYAEKKFLGVIGVEISTYSLRTEIDNVDYGGAFCILANSEGDLIYHKDFPSGLPLGYFEMYDELSPLKEFFSKKDYQNSTCSYMRDNEKHILTIDWLTNGMSLALSVPEAQLFSLQGKMIFQISILFFLTLLISILGIAIVTNKIVKPIEILNQSAHYIAHGELNTKIPVYSKDELGNLAASIRKIEIELSEYIEHIRAMAYKDFMTGCHNKSAYLKKLSDIEKKIDSGLAVFNVYVFDVNGLKHMNDTRGHEMGDALIKGAASALKMTFDEKTIFRTGGDEFVVITEGEKDDINANLETFHDAVNTFNKENEFDFTLSVSAGAATYKSSTDKDYKVVAERADRAMYQDKERFYKENEDLRR